MLKTAEEIIQYIGNAKKQTPVKVYINGHDLPQAEGFKMFGTEDSKICIGDLDAIHAYLEENKDKLNQLADILIEKEVIFKDDLEAIFGKRTWDKNLDEVVS